MNLKIDVSLPVLPVEEQLKMRSRDGKCVMGYFDDHGQFISYWSNLTYMEKLFVIDSLKKRLEYDVRHIDGEN